jgi:hypothetical protein
VQIDHGRIQAGVTEVLLDDTEVDAQCSQPNTQYA